MSASAAVTLVLDPHRDRGGRHAGGWCAAVCARSSPRSPACGSISRRATKRCAHADQSRRQMLADVSHELKTPLTAMRGYLETLQHDRSRRSTS